MPYIKPEERVKFEEHEGIPVIRQEARLADTVGELNYLLTSVLDEWIRKQGLSYTAVNGAIGALECCKLELYRRVVVPYEDDKKETNGDVFRIIQKAEKPSGDGGRGGATPASLEGA